MPVCSVPGCQSGYKDTVQSFTYPKDEKKKKQWMKQIGLTKVSKTAVVCKHHFLDSYIIPAEENVTLKGQPGMPKLRDKAIPTQFSLGPKKQNKRKSSEEVKVVPAKAPRLDHNYTYVNPNKVPGIEGAKHLDGFGYARRPRVAPAQAAQVPPNIDKNGHQRLASHIRLTKDY